jgi:Predicted hydrolases or acyltransferases (alpha/beta hydrolase superfamily)
MNKLNCFIIGLLIILFASCKNETTISEADNQFAEMEDGTKIAYKTLGDEGKPLVFIHGFGCDMNAWEKQAHYFSKTSKVVLIDLPGYGHIATNLKPIIVSITMPMQSRLSWIPLNARTRF